MVKWVDILVKNIRLLIICLNTLLAHIFMDDAKKG